MSGPLTPSLYLSRYDLPLDGTWEAVQITRLGSTAALPGLSAGGSSDSAVLRAWVTAEARLKAGPHASPQVWLSTWEACQLAVAGSLSPPLAGVFDGMVGIYNPTVLQWEAV